MWNTIFADSLSSCTSLSDSLKPQFLPQTRGTPRKQKEARGKRGTRSTCFPVVFYVYMILLFRLTEAVYRLRPERYF
jgi:hypothetical protein